MLEEQGDNIPQSIHRGVEHQLMIFQEKLKKMELDLKDLWELSFTDPKTDLGILFLMRDVEALRSELRWMIGITIAIFVGLVTLAITVVLVR